MQYNSNNTSKAYYILIGIVPIVQRQVSIIHLMKMVKPQLNRSNAEKSVLVML
jgi:hypothetical protein